MSAIIKAAQEAGFDWSELGVRDRLSFADFYAIAYRQGMERAAEIAEAEQDIAEEKKADQRFKDALKNLHSQKATERNAVDRGDHWVCVSTCNAVLRNAAKAIRAEAHAQNQPKNVHDTGNVSKN